MKPSDRAPMPVDEPCYGYATKVEVDLLHQYVDALFDAVSALHDALCNSERDLKVDYAGLLKYGRLMAVDAANVRAIAMKIEKEFKGHGYQA